MCHFYLSGCLCQLSSYSQKLYCIAQYLQMLLMVFFTVSMSVQRIPTGVGMASESGFRHGKACKAVLLKGVFWGRTLPSVLRRSSLE